MPPPDPDDIGRAGWTILHTTAAAFPNVPTPDQQANFRAFIRSWSQVYPCTVCSYHMRQELKRREIVATNKREASRFVCELHNSVNTMLGKQTFNCDPDVVLQQWHPGYPDVSDEPSIEEQIAEQQRASRQAAKPAPAPEKPASGGFSMQPWRRNPAPEPPKPAGVSASGVSDDAVDPAEVLKRLKGCSVWCPDKAMDNIAK